MSSFPGATEPPGLFLMTNSFETGGSERQFAALAQSFLESSFHPRIGCIAKRGDFLEGFGDVLEFPLGGNLYGFRSLRTRLRLARYLRGSRTAVAQAFDFYTNLVLIPAARMAGVPVVIGSQRQLGDLLSPAKFRAQLAVFRWCDAVVCNSAAAAKILLDRGMPESRIVVIGNGLPASAFAAAIPVLVRRSDLLRVGMIARMNEPSKNHGIFLLAAARIAKDFPQTEFILAGDGPLRLELERQTRELGIASRVRFLGDRSDIAGILAALDVSVLPSNSESLSNAILESMAAGVPVVATQVGGNPELVTNDRGILVPPGDENALTHAMERLLRNPAMRAEFGANAKAFAESNFTLAAMQKKYEDLYADLLDSKLRRQPRSYRTLKVDRPPPQLRIAIIAASSRYVGGQSVQAELLLEHWRNDPDVKAFSITIDPPLPGWLRWVESIPVLRTLVRQPIYLSTLWSGLKGADVAHIFSASYWSFLIAPTPALFLARALGKKTMIHYHSGEARDHLRRFRSAAPTLAKAGRLVVPSEYLADVFREFGLAAQVVPNFVDTAQFVFRARNPLRPHLVCTRGFHTYYRVDLVVRAFAEVQREFPNARLDLVGRGPQEDEIRSLVERLALHGVNFTGVASRQEIGRCYDAADIFINASVLDNMPVSILEAFAAGTPVVSSAPEGIRYLVENERTGLLSEPGDATGLAGNVIRLLRDTGLASRVAANAYEQSKRYRWCEVRQEWLDIYRSLITHAPPIKVSAALPEQ